MNRRDFLTLFSAVPLVAKIEGLKGVEALANPWTIDWWGQKTYFDLVLEEAFTAYHVRVRHRSGLESIVVIDSAILAMMPTPHARTQMMEREINCHKEAIEMELQRRRHWAREAK